MALNGFAAQQRTTAVRADHSTVITESDQVRPVTRHNKAARKCPLRRDDRVDELVDELWNTVIITDET